VLSELGAGAVDNGCVLVAAVELSGAVLLAGCVLAVELGCTPAVELGCVPGVALGCAVVVELPSDG
jgi:hypothetical protein